MITYLVEFSILHLVFFGIYKVLLAKETQLSFLRFFLVGSTLLSLILPAIKIPTKAAIPTINTEDIILPMVGSVTPEKTIDPPWYMILIGVISFALTFKLLVTLIQIYGWYQQSEYD